MPALYPRALSNCGTLMSVPLMTDSTITTPTEGFLWRPDGRSRDWATFAAQKRRPRILRNPRKSMSLSKIHSRWASWIRVWQPPRPEGGVVCNCRHPAEVGKLNAQAWRPGDCAEAKDATEQLP